MDKRYFPLVFLLLLAGLSIVQGATPKASIIVSPASAQQWPAEFRVILNVPEDHHLYLDKGAENSYIPVQIDPNGKLTTQGLIIAKQERPQGVYDTLVKATVLRGQGIFTIGLMPDMKRPLPGSQINLEVRYQLCNERTHVCFRPQVTTGVLTLPKPESGSAGKEDANPSMMERLIGLFKTNRSNTPIVFMLMLIAGLLSVATPCVYPMLPITSMIIINRAEGDTSKEKQHALAYLVGIIGTYMILGLVAGMTGGAFNAIMQSAMVNIAFAVFFAFFALSLLGFYELDFLRNEVNRLDQQSARIKSLPGTWLMGSVAGLVISPCVGPIVFALLIHVADTIASRAEALSLAHQTISSWEKFKIAWQGSLMMAGFGLGVGIPFFLVSVIKFKKLPKGGYWMTKIKYGFGFVILYFAYLYFDKGMAILGVGHTVILTLVFGMIALWIAIVYCNVLTLVAPNPPPKEQLLRYFGVISLIIGAWLIIAGLEHIPSIRAVPASPAVAIPSEQSKPHVVKQGEGGIQWYRNYAVAQAMAKKTGKPMFIDFYAKWCANCDAFKKKTVKNAALNKALREDAIAVKLVDREPDFEAFRDHPEHRPLKIGLPYFAILTPDGRMKWSGTDYKATRTMISVLKATSIAPRS